MTILHLPISFRKIVDHPTALTFANEHDMNFFEVSAKTGSNIEPAFQWVVEKVLKAQENELCQDGSVTEGRMGRGEIELTERKKKDKYKLNCCKMM